MPVAHGPRWLRDGQNLIVCAPTQRNSAPEPNSFAAEMIVYRQNLTPGELQMVENHEKSLGRELTDQELYFGIENFRAVIGDV